jgi:vacuolar-type H+-ATPase subunit E/Vma4
LARQLLEVLQKSLYDSEYYFAFLGEIIMTLGRFCSDRIGVMAMSKKDIKRQIEQKLHTIADAAQQQYEKNFKKTHKNVDKQVDVARDRLEELDGWAVESINEALEGVEQKLEKQVTKTVSKIQKIAQSALKKIKLNK